MTMQSAPTGMQPVGDVTDEAMVALATTEMPGAILQASGMTTDGEDQFTHDAADTIGAVIVQTNHDADGGGDRPPTPADRTTVSQELPEDSVQQAHAIPRPSVAPDYGHESVGAVEDDPRDAEQIQRPDVPDDEAEPPYGQRQGRPSDREMMKLAFGRRAERDAERKQTFDERLKAVLTKPTRQDFAPVSDIQDGSQSHVTVGDENSKLPSEITSEMKPTAVGDDEGDGHETNDGATESPSTLVGTAAADDVIPETATGIDDDKDESADDDEQDVPLFDSKALDQLLDESTGDSVAIEDFDREVNDRAFESDWLGAHNDISLQAIREELLRKGEYTAHVDDAGNLLSDPDEYRLAVEVKARIILCVHQERSKDQKREFILRSQTGKRILTYEEQRELKNRLIVVQLRLGVDYKSIAKMARVHPNTVRNVENRAAADPNSKLGNTKRPDGRLNPETIEKIAAASKLRAEGKSNPEIAAAFSTDEKTVAKWFKDPPAQGTTTIEDKPDKKPKHSRATTPPHPPQTIKDFAAGDGVPQRHRRVLDRLGQDTEAYIDRLQARAAETRRKVEAVSDIDEMQNFLLCYSQGLALGELRLRNLLRGGGEIDVEEAVPPGDSSPNKAEHEPETILLGTVMAIEADKVFVALSVGGGGVIDNHDNCMVWHAPLEVDKFIRVRVTGFDWRRGLWKLQPVALQTPAPAPGAIAGSYRDDRCSPAADLAGRKAGPKDKEVF
jgi:transposase